MGILKLVINCLASYLMIIAVFGTTIQIKKFIKSVSECLVNDIEGCTGQDCPNAIIYQHRQRQLSQTVNEVYHQQLLNNGSVWNNLILQVESIYFFTFPVITPVYSKDYSNGNLPQSHPISSNSCYGKAHGMSTSAFLATLLPSFFLFKGAFRINHSNCKFWYYTQVGSILLSCFKILFITLLDLWDITTNGALISVLLGLSQLWLVQSFMEKLERQQRHDRQNRVSSQLLALNDFEDTEVYKKVGELNKNADCV